MRMITSRGPLYNRVTMFQSLRYSNLSQKTIANRINFQKVMQIQVKNSSVEKLKLMTEFQLTEKLCLSDEAPQAGCHQGLLCGEALLLGLMRTLIGICSKI